MTLTALGWRPEGLQLWRDGEQQPLAAPPVSHAARLALRLSRTPAGQLWVHHPEAPVPLLAVVGDRTEPLVHPGAPAPVDRYRVHRGGELSILRDDVVCLRRDDRWQDLALPPGMKVRGVDLDAEGRVWAVGSVPSRRVPQSETEAAIRVLDRPGGAWRARSPRLSGLAAWRTVRAGGLEELRTVDAGGSRVLATSLCAWFLDDESSFLFTLDRPRDRVRRLQDDVVRSIDRSDPLGPRVFTVHGRLWRVDRSAKQTDLRPALRQAVGEVDRFLTVRGVSAQGVFIAVAIELAPTDRASSADPGAVSALCQSSDGGESFVLLRRDEGAEAVDWAGVQTG